VRRAAAILTVLLLTTTAAVAQQSIHPKTVVDPEEGLPLYKSKHLPAGWLDVARRPQDPGDLAGIDSGSKGGHRKGHAAAAAAHARGHARRHGRADQRSHLAVLATRTKRRPVEMRGGCMSACTLITGFVPKEWLCFAPGAFLAFHATRTAEAYPRRSLTSTWQMYAAYPPEIKHWIDARGGPNNLPMEAWWTMSDRDLWAIGYPKCK
jgi:hypothetical protein